MSEEKKKFDIIVKSNTRDLFAFTKLVPSRKKRFEKASSEPITKDPMNELAMQLHPLRQYLVISEIINETNYKSSNAACFINKIISFSF